MEVKYLIVEKGKRCEKCKARELDKTAYFYGFCFPFQMFVEDDENCEIVEQRKAKLKNK